ncbi:amino acid permease [Robiginitalea sp.]|nr:amino acid permease [Robiginitalea sp.]
MPVKENQPTLGIWMSISLVIGNMIGAGIFLMPAALAPYGGISIIGWLISAAGALVLARVFSRLTLMVPGISGGPYTFARAGLGDFAGFLVAWGYWLSICVANAAIAIAFTGALEVLFPILKTAPAAALCLSLMAIWMLTWINNLGLRSSGVVQVVTTILKLFPMVLLIGIGWFFWTADNFIPFNPSGETSLRAIAITGTLTLYAFLGLESATIPSDKVKHPDRTIPKATLIGTLITTLVYILSSVVVMGMIPASNLANSTAPFAEAMGIIAGTFGEDLVAVGTAIAAFGALNGWILIQSQVARATARDGLLPKIFGYENKRGVPAYGLAIGSGLCSLLVAMNYTEGLVTQFRFLILLCTLCTLIPYLFSAAAYTALSLQRATGRQVGGIVLIGGLAFAYSLWAVYGAGEAAVFWGFHLLILGIPIYVFMKWKNSKESKLGD